MKLDTPRHFVNATTIGVETVDGQKAIKLGLKDTILTIKLNEAQARMIAYQLENEEF